MNESHKLSQLRDILLSDERHQVEALYNKWEDEAFLREKLAPHIQQSIEIFKENFPDEFEDYLNKLMEQKIRNSQDEIITILYPAMGTMIKKYIANEFEKLTEKIDKQLKGTMAKLGFWKRVKYQVSGAKTGEVILSNMDRAVIEEIFIIEKNSGLLVASAQKKHDIVDDDMVAGMLTAIKAFVEDAFHQNKEEIESIRYGTFHIVVQNFYSYYIAAAIKGGNSASFRDWFSAKSYDFAKKYLQKPDPNNESQSKLLRSKLQKTFIDAQLETAS